MKLEPNDKDSVNIMAPTVVAVKREKEEETKQEVGHDHTKVKVEDEVKQEVKEEVMEQEEKEHMAAAHVQKLTKMVSKPAVLDPSMQETLVEFTPSPIPASRALLQDSNPLNLTATCETPLASRDMLAQPVPAMGKTASDLEPELDLQTLDEIIARKEQLNLNTCSESWTILPIKACSL